MTGIVPPPLPVSALPAVAARSTPNTGTKPFSLAQGQVPGPGTYAGTVRIDAATGHVLFVGQGLKLVLPATAMGSPPAPVPAVLRVLAEPRDGRVQAQVLPTATTSAPPPGPAAPSRAGPNYQPLRDGGQVPIATYGPPAGRTPPPPLPAAPAVAAVPVVHPLANAPTTPTSAPPPAHAAPAAPTPPSASAGPSWRPTAWSAGGVPPPPPAVVPFTPLPLARSASDPVVAEVAARLGNLARLDDVKLGPARGQRVLALSDQVPTSLPAVGYGPMTGPLQQLVVAVGDPPPDAADGPPRRLVLEIDLAHLGRIRLDGLADQGRFDVLLAGVPAEVRPGLRALWSMVVQRTGLVGDLGFLDGPGE